jgi:hypothetical protein
MISQADQLNCPTASLFAGNYLAPGGSATRYGINIEGDQENTVDGNFRVGGDYITGNNPAGWQTHTLTNSNVAYYDGLTSTPYVAGVTLSAGNKTIIYKVIGKTVHLSFKINNFSGTVAFGPFGQCPIFYIELPSSIYPKSTTYSLFSGSGRWYCSDSIFSGDQQRASAYVSLYQSSDIPGAPANKYYIAMFPNDIVGFPFTSSQNSNVFGHITYELPQ